MAEKSVEKLFAEILKDYKAVASEAIEKAANLAQDDIYEYAYGCLRRYYNNYQPKMYRRKNNLIKSIVPIFECSSTRRKIAFTIGVEYDSSKLEGLYKSNSWYHQGGDRWISSGYFHGPVFGPPQLQQGYSFNSESQDNGIVDPGWILNNYLYGIHPWGKGPYMDKKDTASDKTYNRMKDYFKGKEITNNITEYIQDELFDLVVSRLQKG